MSLHEKCGVFGASIEEGNIFPFLYWGMLAQNHRGHQSHGFATLKENIDHYTQLGLIPPNNGGFESNNSHHLEGKVGIANVRYVTSGSLDFDSKQRDAMPIIVKGEKHQLAISFNGNIVNVRELQKQLGVDNSYSDTHALSLLLIKKFEETGSLEESVVNCMKIVDGGFSVAGIIDDGSLFAFKDPMGIKPLCYGKSNGIHAFSSDSVGLDINGIDFDHELKPGELIVIKNNRYKSTQVVPWKRKAFCAFEFAYFMRPDARVGKKFVYKARKDFGIALAQYYKEKAQRCDIILSLPETADDAAYGFHEETGLPWERATRRHRYVTQRAFISESEDRQNVIFRKLNILKPMIEGKNLAIIDDSIVRGDTTKNTVKRLRESDSGEIHLFITFPKIIGPCFYGIDMSTYSELIGARLDDEEIAAEIGADSVNYLPIKEYVKCTGLNKYQLCLGCITGDYPTLKADALAKEMKKKINKGIKEMGRIYEVNPELKR